jgi:hypothetical protein
MEQVGISFMVAGVIGVIICVSILIIPGRKQERQWYFYTAKSETINAAWKETYGTVNASCSENPDDVIGFIMPGLYKRLKTKNVVITSFNKI